MKSPNSRISIDLDTLFFDFVEGFQSDPDTALDSLSLLLLDPVTCRARIEKLKVDASYAGLSKSAADFESIREACDFIAEKGLFAAFNDGDVSSKQLVSIACNPDALQDVFCRLWPDDLPLPPEFAETRQPLSTPKVASSDTVRFGAEGSETRLGDCPKDAFEDCLTQLATLWNHPGHVAQQVSQIAKAVDDWSRSGNLAESHRIEIRSKVFSTLNDDLSNQVTKGFWIEKPRFVAQIRDLIQKSVAVSTGQLELNDILRIDLLVKALEIPLQQAVREVMLDRAVVAALTPEQAEFYRRQSGRTDANATTTTAETSGPLEYSISGLHAMVREKLVQQSFKGESDG